MSKFTSKTRAIQKNTALALAFQVAGISPEQFKNASEPKDDSFGKVDKKARKNRRFAQTPGRPNTTCAVASSLLNQVTEITEFKEYYPGITYKVPLASTAIKNTGLSGAIASTVEQPKIISKGVLIPNTSGFVYRPKLNREVPKYNGIKSAITTQSDNEAELIIGLDFGTSSVKVVVHDPQRRIFYAVPFYSLGSDQRFFFPTRVWLGTEGYSLDCGETLITRLKLPLLEAQPAVESDTLIHATAFLALIIRHVRGWVLSRYEDIYKNSDILWGLNLGLPVAYSEDQGLSDKFRVMALSALNLAGDDTPFITGKLVKKYLSWSRLALTGSEMSNLPVTPDMVDVFPEIGAQVKAFLESESWDAKNRPFVVMVDIGAGTVDMSIFSVTGSKNDPTFNFFRNRVKEYGVMNLHASRINWINRFYTDDIGDEARHFMEQSIMATDSIIAIPDNISNYFYNALEILSGNPDDDFFKDCKQQVYGIVNETRSNCIPMNDEVWKKFPFFLCGGGARMQFYRRIIEQINQSVADRGIYLDLMSLERPGRLRAEGLADGDYDRLSVAYGLSFPEIGRIIPSRKIKDFSWASSLSKEKPIDQTDDG